MLFKTAFVALLSTVAVVNGFAPPRPLAVSRGGRCVCFFCRLVELMVVTRLKLHSHTPCNDYFFWLCSLPMSTTEEPKVEGKKAVDAPPTHLGWDSHNPVVCFLVVVERSNNIIKSLSSMTQQNTNNLTICFYFVYRTQSPTVWSEKATVPMEIIP
jgi:hypothetical protein